MTDKESILTRREFLAAATGMVAAGMSSVIPSVALAGDDDSTEVSQPEGKIAERTLGRTGITVPVVSMGVMNADNPGVVKASYELGVRHFDTAAYYQFGRNEQMVGRVLNKMGVRDKCVIGTKIYTAEQRVDDPAAAKKKIIELCEGSLSRLGTDYVDILYIHSVSHASDLDNEGVMEGFAELKKQGKIRASGISTHSRMAEVIDKTAEQGFYDVILTSYNFTLADDGSLIAAIDKAAAAGAGIVAMKTQAGGSRLGNPENTRKYTSTVMATAALKWVLQNKNVHTTIPGYDNYEHMKEDFSVASNLEFSDIEKAFLEDNEVKLGMGFCRQCGDCLALCPKGADVPTLMRSHMYTTKYANFGHAKSTMKNIPSGRGLEACAVCSHCDARCSHSVDIARSIEELKVVYS